ncbi:MAG: peptide chain release factor N(5)-glutamine methyltransferase [Acidobacteria bacterium]|nr:MAG: peptide chain release factor N(5)-glutamine methyltransferase [Acidobacteriota bacterium]
MTIHQAILHGEALLREYGVEQPRWNAERLLLLALKQDRAQIYLQLHRQMSAEELQNYLALVQKRMEHYPLAYLEGTQDFFGREFYVDENVLIPRPETEEIVHAVLELKLPAKPRILDLGSGSGNLASTLALQIPASYVVALEFSLSAIGVLKRNLQPGAEIVRGNLFTPPFLQNSFDVIVSNPPYVEESSFRELPAETRWEPRLALVTPDLEETYRSLLIHSANLLKNRGYLVFEIGFGQAERIQNLCALQRPLSLLQIRKDQREIPRTFVLRRS